MFNLNEFETNINKKLNTTNKKIDINANDIKKFFKKNGDSKNSFYFENLSDDCFFDIAGANPEFVEFYKRIIKSGVGSIILGGVYLGINEKKDNVLARITLDSGIMSAYKKIINFAHSFGCKIYLQVKSIYGRFNQLYNKTKKIKYASNYGLDPENKNKILIRISDNKCQDLINDLHRIVLLSNIAGFDGIMIDASFNNIIGELSSSEYNKRIFGYYSDCGDFLNRALKQIDTKTNRIILKLNVMTLLCEDDKNAFLVKNKRNFNIKSILSNIRNYISLGVDSFEFVFGTKENEFLSIFNSYQDEMIFEFFYISIHKYLNSNNIKNKFGEEVSIYCHDNIINYKTIEELLDGNVISFINVTKNIYSDLNYLKNLFSKKLNQNCIKCSYCNKITQFKSKIECLINPGLLAFENEIVNKKLHDITIVGSGISALICALTLAKRGYKIKLFEQKNTLNPIGKLMTIFETEMYLKNYYDYIEQNIYDLVDKKIIQLNLNCKFTIDDLTKHHQTIVVATGFKTKLLTIIGAVQSHVHNIYDVLNNKKIFANKKNIVIYAKSILSLQLTKYLSENSDSNLMLIIKDIDFILQNKNANLSFLFYNLYKNHVKIMFYSRISKINEDNIELNFCHKIKSNSIKSYLKIISNDKLNFDRRQQNFDCDLLIYEPEIIPNNTLYSQIVSMHYPNEVYLIGNALEDSDLAEQIKSGYYVGKNI